MREALLALACGLIVGAPMLVAAACTPAQLSQVQDASNKRQVICDFVAVWAPNQPDLKHIHELCQAGADLKEIAGAYAGCPAPKAEGK